MQMQSSETKAGVTICRAPSMIAVSTSLPCSRCQLMFSIVTVASSTRMPTASASPPSVMMLSVSPIAASAMIEPSTASGIDVAMMMVERQLPRNSRIIRLVSAAAMTPSRATPDIAARTNSDWSPSKPILQTRRQRVGDVGELLLDAGNDRQGRGRAALQHLQQHGAVAVDMNDVGLRRVCRRGPARRRARRPWRR